MKGGRTGLGWKIFLFTMIPYFAVTFTVSMLTIQNKVSYERGLVLNRLVSFTRLLEDGAIGYDSVAEKEKLERFFDEVVVTAKLVKRDGDVLYSTDGMVGAHGLLPEEAARVSATMSGGMVTFDEWRGWPPVVVFSYPIRSDHAIAGVFYAELTYRRMGERINLYVLFIVVLNLAGLALMYALTRVFSRRMVLDPIRRLTSASAELARGNLDHRIEIQSRDEIGLLAHSFNRMAAELGGARSDLEGQIRVREKTEETLKDSLGEREALIRELYHRTKNNMQLISSMLSIQARSLGNPEFSEIVSDLKRRIQTMALVHQKLFQANDLSHVSLRSYIGDLARLVMQGFEDSIRRVDMIFEIEEIDVLFDIAVPCGLLVSELLSNSFKHAFTDVERGRIRIAMSSTGDHTIELMVSDNGVGMPEGFDPRKEEHLGLQTVFTIAEAQLGGTASLESTQGVTWRFSFRDDSYSARV